MVVCTSCNEHVGTSTASAGCTQNGGGEDGRSRQKMAARFLLLLDAAMADQADRVARCAGARFVNKKL